MNLQTKVCFKTFISNHLLKVCNIVCALLYLLHTCIERLKTILQNKTNAIIYNFFVQQCVSCSAL